MKKKNAFTLIELLAVIVILAIIALIVTPVVSNIVSNAKIAANARSVEGHIRNIELAIISEAFETDGDMNKYDNVVSGDIIESSFQLPDNDNITCESYIISNGTIQSATGCTEKDDNWSKIYAYTIENGAEASADNSASTVVYSYSNNFLFIGDKIDMENRKITNNVKRKENSNKVEETNETYDMTGIYSTDLDDVLTVSVNPDGTEIESKSNNVYLKHTIDSEGTIKKTEVCIVLNGETLCVVGNSEYIDNEGTGSWVISGYSDKTTAVLNFLDVIRDKEETLFDGCMYDSVHDYRSCWYKNDAILLMQAFGNTIVFAQPDGANICGVVNGCFACGPVTDQFLMSMGFTE